MPVVKLERGLARNTTALATDMAESSTTLITRVLNIHENHISFYSIYH